MIDLTLIRFRYAHDHDNAPLARWLRSLAVAGAVVRDSVTTPRVDLTRNAEVARWLKGDETHRLLMIDSDMVPVAETAAVLEAEGDLVACPYVGQDGKIIAWQTEGIYTGCMRVSRVMMNGIVAPWFDYQTSESGCRPERGEAWTFLQKALAWGAEPVIVGRVGHRLPAIFLPGPTAGQPEVRFE